MPDRILVPLDGSDPSWAALELALSEHPSAEIVVFHVINPMEGAYAGDVVGSDYWEAWHDNAVSRAERLFEAAREEADNREAALVTVREVGSPSRTILEYAEENDVDHVVMGSHGRKGVSRILLGSVAESVVRRAAVPVTIVR